MLEKIYSKIDIISPVLKDLKGTGKVLISGCVPSQKEHLINGIRGDFRHKVIIGPDEQKAMEILENYMAFDRSVLYYPARDPMFYKADIRGNYISEQRMEVVKKICEGENCTIITSPDSFSDKLASLKEIREKTLVIKKGDSIDEKELAATLTDMGFENGSQVTGHGEYSIRGNIIDVFPFTADAPFRLDLWGDQIETIKVFDQESQRSIEEVAEFTIFAGADKDTIDGGDVSFLSYFEPAETLVVIDEAEKADEEFIGLFSEYPCLYLSMLGGRGALSCDSAYTVNARNINSYNGRFSELVTDIARYKEDGWNVTLCCASQSRADRLRKDLEAGASGVDIEVGAVRSGFEYRDLKEVLISEVDIFGQKRAKKRQRKRFSGDPIKAFTDLNIGDYVVHEQHGVGIYSGIERIKTDGLEKDYMKIQYANNANLYVLATQFDRIQKYSGAESAKPKINKLGGKEWAGTKAKTRAAVADIAAELVRLYAARQVKRGHIYGPDTVWQKEFEDQFEFEETDDQLRAIEDIKSDMESGKIMDRLICGDVGFGKTEVAIRAAFKAVQDGKQVAFLAPTTILVKQHFDTIVKRMANYPVNVRMLSRFVSTSQQKKTVEELKNGTADIVVGTHRLFSKDVAFKDLGLLIVDEEQRFGVAHKEKIKELRKDVDVLTLSATPIPRTLHMSLSGIRDMSLLTEPPVDRVPIQTYVMEYSEDAVREAILRETARGGQVYYIHNRIGNIENVCANIQQLVPTLNVQFAHGRMSARELEQIMTDYVSGDIDVLVSTTIVESGLDIPNVNTIIVQDADYYGLSQLYQLRGRVGRADRMAYAFLMYKGEKILREVAEQRLKAIREFSDLGGGIKIAMKDMEIRGAGNVLGAEQSGHMEAVGYELYCKMLNEAVSLLKGELVEEDYETTIDLKIDGYIPSEYIKNSYEKLNMYKKISSIMTLENMEDVREELNDRFGPVPQVTENLLKVALLKEKAHERYITEISGSAERYRITMFQNAKIDTYKMHGFLSRRAGELKFVAERTPYFTLTPKKPGKDLDGEIEVLKEFIEGLDEIIINDKK